MKFLLPFIRRGGGISSYTISHDNGNLQCKLSTAADTVTFAIGSLFSRFDFNGKATNQIVTGNIGNGQTLIVTNTNSTLSWTGTGPVNNNAYLSIITGSLPSTFTIPSGIAHLLIQDITNLSTLILTGVGPRDIICRDIASLQNVDVSGITGLEGTPRVGNWNSDSLNQASVDALLAMYATYGGAIDVDLAGGTNATPSAAGLASKATIISNGGSVINN